MQKTTVLGSIGAVLVLVACASAQEESGTAGAADTTATSGTTATNGSATTGTTATGTGRTTRTTSTGTRAGSTNGSATTNGTATANADGGAAPLGCYASQGTCEPTNPTACGTGETCDIDGSSGQFTCFPPPNDAQLGGACNNQQGPFCAQGLACDDGTCKTYCCDDSVCAAGTTCQQTGTVGTIAIKVCK